MENSNEPEAEAFGAAAAPLTGPQRWAALVERIRSSDQEAMEELYRTFARGVRYYLCRHLGPGDLDDRVHDAFLIVVQAIQNGTLREPERLMGFVRTVARRQVLSSIEEVVQRRRDYTDLEVGSLVPDERQDPERSAEREQQTALVLKILRGVPARDREILTRFYLHEQPQEQICAEMDLTENQFRLMKSRAKARFGELGRRKLERTPLRALFMRKASGA